MLAGLCGTSRLTLFLVLCDTFFAGACTAFEAFNSGALDPIDCVDDPGSDLCSFAGPGKRDVRQMKG